MIKKKIYMCILVLLLGLTFPALSQNISISGTVKDAQGEPLMGVVVTDDNGKSVGISDVDGNFTVSQSLSSAKMTFTLLGYKSVTVKSSDSPFSIVMSYDIHDLNSTVELGYTSVSKEDFSGSVSVLHGKQMQHAPVTDIRETFSGNIPGLYSGESYSEPARQSYDFAIRGISTKYKNQPLVIVDGVICYPGLSGYTLDYITPNEIDQVSILKDPASQSLFGGEGTEGVIVVTTKKGVKGKTQVNCYADFSMLEPTTKPRFINSWEYAEMRNQAAFNDGYGSNYYYSNQDIDNYKNHTDPYLYPNTNWYKMNMRQFMPMERGGVNLSGGNEWITFFTNVNVMHDDGPFKTEKGDGQKSNDYHRNLHEFWFNYRSNLDFKLSSWLGATLNIAGNVKKEHTPGGGYFMSTIYPHLFSIPSAVYGPVTPAIDGADYPSNQVIVTQNENDSPYGLINRTGYTNYTVNNLYAKFGLNFDLGFLVKGLTFGGSIAYKSYSRKGLMTTKNYRRYQRDISSSDLEFIRKGTSDNSSLSYGTDSDEFYDLYYRGDVGYKLDLGDHHMTAKAFGWYQRYESSGSGLPYDHALFGTDLNYNYMHKYALRLTMGYSGDSEFKRSERWTATPAASASWTISKENFMKSLPFVSLAKLRLAYGVTANDRIGIGRFYFEDKVNVVGGGPIGSLGYLTSENSYGNPNIHAEKFYKSNIGIDLGLFNWFDFSLDIFSERCNNMVCGNTVNTPSFQGIPLGSIPQTNSGKMKNHGYEVQFSVGQQFKDFEFKVGANMAYYKDKILKNGETSLGDDYVAPYRSEGWSYGQSFGYKVDYSNGNGMYNFQSELDQAPKYSFGTPRLGDLKYMDLNNDGTIDDKDKTALTYSSIPRITYGINGYLKYKNLDFSVLFDGWGKYKYIYSGMGIYESSYDGVYSSLHLHAWTQDRWNNDECIKYPALSTKTSTNHQPSDFFVYNCAFFRLKNVEIGYTLPKNWSKAVRLQNIRFVLSGQNLITWDHMKSNDFGPESNYSTVPVYRTYNVGVRASF